MRSNDLSAGRRALYAQLDHLWRSIWRREIRDHRRNLLKSDIPFLEVTYEELFGLRIDGLIDPARSKINSADSYRLVPGIERLKRRLGSSENGWLFR